ncbi:hypothetical protein PPSIR1_39220 [Plesiocystis pacifica SIR-1]|uniref:Uncharacterized protein n=1 Tax=Plesiocystis pacifica SIR-1 TaxID=391625 RepID=A6GKE3_9BACT|nr:hypothetical protein [Plesiocystis pacifica]EDM73663.1 hypothetical protein PPSIR1_39220 [Plesiocystis pacifica SIR-1]
MRLEMSQDGDSVLLLDARHFPIVICKWEGPPTEALASEYIDWLGLMIERAEFYETRLIHVIEASKIGRPGAIARRILADGAAERKAMHAEKGAVIATYLNPDSAIVRGILAVIRWSLGTDGYELNLTESLRASVTAAVERLAEAGVEAPPDLNPVFYELELDPQVPMSARSSSRMQISKILS